jgi:5-methylcytosine-specific restriction protein A
MAYNPRPAKKKKAPRKITNNIKERQAVYQSGSWRPLRDAYLAEHPLCEDCLAEGRTTPAVEVHHVTSFVGAGDMTGAYAYNWHNLVALCRECHRKRHGIGRKGF